MENFRSHLPAGALPPYFDQLPFNHRSDVGSMVRLSLALSLCLSLNHRSDVGSDAMASARAN